MLSMENVSYDGEWVMDAPGSTITVRENRDLDSPELTFSLEVDPPLDLAAVTVHPLYRSGAGPAPRKWRTSSRQRKWRYLLKNESDSVLYKGAVEDSTVMNTATGREYALVSYEVNYCGPDSSGRRFSASGTESSRAAAIMAIDRIARQHHSGMILPSEN